MKRHVTSGIVIFLLCVFVLGMYISQHKEEDVAPGGDRLNEVPNVNLGEQPDVGADDPPLSPTNILPELERIKAFEKGDSSDDDWQSSEVNYVLLSDMETWMKGDIRWEFNSEERIHDLYIDERHFQYIEGTNVGKEHHRYFPMRDGISQTENGTAVCSDFIKYGLGYEIQKKHEEPGQRYLYLSDAELFAREVQAAGGNAPVKEWSVEQRNERMVNLACPIAGATVTPKSSQWPGAPRPYRNGYHEGLDMYAFTSGVIVNKMTDILSMDQGIVIRADHGYVELQKNDRDQLLAIASQRPITPEYILDEVRGRSIWIQHSNGVIGRYVHLDQIADDVQVGKPVSKGQVIGKAGNSGTSYGVEGNDEGVHLHLDILIDGQLFWEGLSPEQTVGILKKVFSN